LNDFSLQEGTKPTDPQQKSDEKIEGEAVEEKIAGEQPQGYQVCDFETGLCHWVPANKSPDTTATSTPVPEQAIANPTADVVAPADIAKVTPVKENTKVESNEKLVKEEEKEKEVTLAPPVEITTTAPAEDKDNEPSTTTMATNTTKNKKGEAETEAEQDGYQVCDFNTGVCYWVPAKKAKVDSEQPTEGSAIVDETKKEEATKDAAPVVAVAVPSSPASGLDPKQVAEETGSGARTPLSGSGSPNGQSSSSSPGSLNPGPRLVGKLSRDRLAMFENS
jgi:hypothetical protein